MIYAFARDGGLPASKRLAHVSARHRTPEAAIWAAALLSFAFVIGAKALEASGTPVYTIVVSCTVIFLFPLLRAPDRARAAELWRHQVAAHGPVEPGARGVSRCSLYWHWPRWC